MNNPKFTGRRRHRTLHRRFHRPVLVLQLEVEGYVMDYIGGAITGTDETWWIDAKIEHITEKVRNENENI